MATAITTRSTFAATLRSIQPTISAIGTIPKAGPAPRAIHLASVILNDADRILATIEAAPEWLDRELTHGRWAEVSAAVADIRAAFDGSTLSDIRDETNALKRATARITSATTSTEKALARNAEAKAEFAKATAAPKAPRTRKAKASA
jgi:hypothetical protein